MRRTLPRPRAVPRRMPGAERYPMSAPARRQARRFAAPRPGGAGRASARGRGAAAQHRNGVAHRRQHHVQAGGAPGRGHRGQPGGDRSHRPRRSRNDRARRLRGDAPRDRRQRAAHGLRLVGRHRREPTAICSSNGSSTGSAWLRCRSTNPIAQCQVNDLATTGSNKVGVPRLQEHDDVLLPRDGASPRSEERRVVRPIRSFRGNDRRRPPGDPGGPIRQLQWSPV